MFYDSEEFSCFLSRHQNNNGLPERSTGFIPLQKTSYELFFHRCKGIETAEYELLGSIFRKISNPGFSRFMDHSGGCPVFFLQSAFGPEEKRSYSARN
jgi:hypothetical protein